MVNIFSDDEIQKNIEKMIKQDQKENRQIQNKQIPSSTKTLNMIRFERNPQRPMEIISIDYEVKASGVLNHYVWDEEKKVYYCKGITFVDGHYVSLEDEAQESASISTG